MLFSDINAALFSWGKKCKDMHLGENCRFDLGLITMKKGKSIRPASVRVVTDSLPRQQCGSDPSKGASAKHGGPDGCLLLSVQQKGQPAKRPGGPSEEPEGQQVGRLPPPSSQQLSWCSCLSAAGHRAPAPRLVSVSQFHWSCPTLSVTK